MDVSIVRTYMSDILHAITQGLLVPDIALLILFIVYGLFCIGSILAELVSERRHFKVTMPKFLAALMAAREDEIPEVIEQSGLLKRQKVALLTVYDYRVLPGDALVALIKRLVNEEESRYDRISGRNNMAARVSPMLGLMGTLIPLGPGIQALGKADVDTLSTSLLIAFDTTVAGLVVAAVCMVVGKIRSNWYANYMSALDSAMATMLQKIEDMRAEGKIVTEEPSDYAFMFEKSFHAPRDKAEDKPAEAAPEKREADAPAGGTRSAIGAPSGYPATSSASVSVPEAAPTPAISPAPAISSVPAINPAPAVSPAPTTLPPLPGGDLRAQQPVVSTPARSASANPWSPSASQTSSFERIANPAAGPAVEPQPQFGAFQQPKMPETYPYATGAMEPIRPFAASAPFEPVPDPSFISDLANAQAASAAADAQLGAPTGAQPANGWYQPPVVPESLPGNAAGRPSHMSWGTKGSAAPRDTTDRPSN